MAANATSRTFSHAGLGAARPGAWRETETRADRRERVGRNADLLGVPDLEIIAGAAPEALAGLPQPDAVFVGGAVIPITAFSAERYFEGIQRHRATDILCVPTMAIAMVECDARERYDLRSLTAILCGSAPAPVWLWTQIEKDFGVSEIVTGYGMTECGGAMTLTAAIMLAANTLATLRVAPQQSDAE